MNSRFTPALRYIAFFVFIGLFTAAFILLPPEASILLFLLLAVVSLIIGFASIPIVQSEAKHIRQRLTDPAARRNRWRGKRSIDPARFSRFLTARTWELEHVSIRQVLLELGLIVLVSWAATRTLHNFSDQVQLSGNDMVHLTRSADFAGQILRISGKIPLWDPFIGNGQPMLEAAQSFILNPFMSVPIMLLGAKPGVLIVVLLHSLIFGWGGWVWARVMGFGMGGRLLMGALLVSSGSVTGPLSHGVFQLALSQAYMPYIYAGLTAMLFVPNQRWGLVLFVVATALLIFSGTFWYVLPTALGCALIAAFALTDFQNGKRTFNRAAAQTLLLAGVLVVGLAAIRMVPINRELLYHPIDSYNFQLSYVQVFINYFDPHYTLDVGQWFVVYHYVVPAWLMTAILPLALVTLPWLQHRLVGGWRIVAAGILFVLIISLFGTGPTPAVNAVYSVVPFLQDWRNPGRMAAAASPWIVLAAAWAFDRLTHAAWRLIQQTQTRRLIGAASLLALTAGGLAGVMQVADNWQKSLRLVPTANIFPVQQSAAALLRERYPSQFLAVHTSWITHFTLNEFLMRHAYGDDDVFTLGVPPTIGVEQREYVEEFAFGDTPDSGNGIWLLENGYVEMENMPAADGIGAVADYNAEALPYAYVVSELMLLRQRREPLTRSQTQPITYYHRIDQVEVEVFDPIPAAVVVIQETAYPGWTVTINGDPQPLESVHRRLAVRVPADVKHARIVFSYQPPRLVLGAIITCMAALLLSVYALRIDQRFFATGADRRTRSAVQLPASEIVRTATHTASVIPVPVGLKKHLPETSPGEGHQTDEGVPGRSLNPVVVVLAVVSAAIVALGVLAQRAPAKKE